jgi:3-methyl-2-oxobutanoate hydroxymethyltransferase
MASTGSKKVTNQQLGKMKREGRKIAMITAYDATFAQLVDEAGVDIILVGDSVGMVVQGQRSTLGVTMDEMTYHCRAVARGTARAQVVGDMPFMSYQVSIEEGLRNAGRLVKEGGAEAVKLEGGAEYAELASRLVRIGIPVMGHIGLTPQSYHQLGGWKVQGRSDAAAHKLVEDARALSEAGCYAIVLEGIFSEVARDITAAVACPTIGIGAGPDCDGQVLVIYDLLGMSDRFRPKFVKRYDNLAVRIRTAVEDYVDDVRERRFPDEDHAFSHEGQAVEAAPYGAPERGPERVNDRGGATRRDDSDASGTACIPLRIHPRRS